MKKIAFGIFFVFAALFVLITLSKKQSPREVAEQEVSNRSAIDKEKVLKFWELYRKATEYRLDEQWALAAENYRHALELNEQHEDALYYLGNMYFELSRFKEAESCWEKLIEVNPKSSRGFRQLSHLYLTSEELLGLDKAEAACREALKLNKEETGPMLSLGEVMLIRGQLDEAASHFAAVYRSNFKSIEAYFLGGYVAWKNGDRTEARNLFEQAVKYSNPEGEGHKKDKVLGEGDTKPGKGFGQVASKSVFRQFLEELRGVQPEQLGRALEKTYTKLDAALTELRKKHTD